MSQFLKYSDVSVMVQDEMAGQAPAETKIARAVDAEFRNILTKYNVEASIRTIDVSMKTDGLTTYLISTLITDNDVDSVYGLYQDDSDTNFDRVDLDKITKDAKAGRPANQYCVYYEEGKMYITVMSLNMSDVTEDFTIKYYTTSRSLDIDGDYLATIDSVSTVYILLPEKYLDLISLGAMKRLFYQAIGENDTAQVAIVRNRYESELSRLGLSSNAKKSGSDVKKVKLRVQW